MPNTGTMPAYNLPQTVFMLSLGSNALFGETGTQAQLQTNINQFLRGYQPGSLAPNQTLPIAPFYQFLNPPNAHYPSLAGGDWSTVWGPYVYVATIDGEQINPGATNMMFVAYSKSQKTYVVAIAGTNPKGWSAALVQDLKVGPAGMVAWPPVQDPNNLGQLKWAAQPSPAANQPAIDAGTSAGLDVLYTMVCPYSNQTLVAFLDPSNPNGANAQSGQTIVFTGHSLGGALSPSLAMLLYPQAEKSLTPPPGAPNPNASQWEHVFILATAGPTPGNAGFANLFYSPVEPTPLPNPSPAPVPVAYPPSALSLTGVSGNYMPIATGVAAPSDGIWPLMYWNMDYANVYDVVPRAWTLLAGLVQQPPKGDYPSFFANGASLASTSNNVLEQAVGPFAYDLIGKLKGFAGYGGTNATPYYAHCLMHFPINGTWGTWTTGQPYPATFMDEATPTTFQSFAALTPYILDAHLDQYSQALLGYPGLQIAQTVLT